MTITVTRQYIEVAGRYTDGEARVYRQYASVLTQGSAGATLNESASDTLNLTQNVLGYAAKNVSDVLVFTQNAFREPSIFVRSFTDTLNFVHNGTKDVPGIASNTLSFSELEFEFNYVGDREIPYNTLNLIQTVLTLSGIAIENTLNFQHTVNVVNTSVYAFASDWLHLFQHTPMTHRAWFTDDLALYVNRATVPKVHSLAHVLAFVQRGRMTTAQHILAFVQTAEAAFGYTVINYLELDDQQARLVDYIRHQYEDLGIGHSLGWYMDSPCSRKQYTPFQGENTIPGALTPPSSELPYVQVSPMTDRMLLYYPARGPQTYTVTLRAPEMDNRDRNSYTRISRETAGGKLVVFADPTWPHIRTMVVTIIGLQKTAIDSFQVFKQATLGKEVGVTDWEGRVWAGVITNPNEPVTQDGPTSWTLTFEFEGELLDGQYPNSTGLALSDSVSYVLV